MFLTWGCQNHPLARIATSFFGFWGAVDISGHSAAFKGAIAAKDRIGISVTFVMTKNSN